MNQRGDFGSSEFEAIVVGVSAGGLEALSAIIPVLPRDFALPVIVVQHMKEDSEPYLSLLLNGKSEIHVKEAEEKEIIAQNTVYIAPAGYHLLIEADRSFSLSMDEKVNFARPSIDVLFESAADVYASRLVGVILTGANSDGSRGLRKIKERNGLAVVQDPETAASDFMPKSAIRATEVDQILGLKDIGPFLSKLDRSQTDTCGSPHDR